MPDDRAPDPECQRCHGKEIGRVYFADTRSLSPQAVALLASIEVTKNGMKYRLHSRLEAIEKMARRLGMDERDNKQKLEPLAEPIAYIHANQQPFRSSAARCPPPPALR